VPDDRGASRHAVIGAVPRDVLHWADHLRLDTDIPESLSEVLVEHAVTLRPDPAFFAEERGSGADEPTMDSGLAGDELEEPEPAPTSGEGPWRMLGTYAPWGAHPLARITAGGWTASPVERLAVLLRARDVPVGLVTDGRWWALVWAPRGGATGAAVWDASLWSEEPDSLQALVALLHRSRFLAVADADTLPRLLLESLERQEEVTETLGRQVREAVEMLVGTLDELDHDSGRALLAGEQALEHRTSAWHRLLAVTRAVHAGVAHEDLRLPADGGGLFDPDRYPWLEGRTAGAPAGAARPPARRGRPDRAGDAARRPVRAGRRAAAAADVPGARRRADRLRLRGPAGAGGTDRAEVVLGFVRPPKWPRVKETCEVGLSDAVERVALGARSPSLADWLAARTGWSRKRLETVLASPLEAERRAALRGCWRRDFRPLRRCRRPIRIS